MTDKQQPRCHIIHDAMVRSSSPIIRRKQFNLSLSERKHANKSTITAPSATDPVPQQAETNNPNTSQVLESSVFEETQSQKGQTTVTAGSDLNEIHNRPGTSSAVDPYPLFGFEANDGGNNGEGDDGGYGGNGDDKGDRNSGILDKFFQPRVLLTCIPDKATNCTNDNVYDNNYDDDKDNDKAGERSNNLKT